MPPARKKKSRRDPPRKPSETSEKLARKLATIQATGRTKHVTYSDDELRAIATAARRLASCVSVLRATEPRDVRRYSKNACFALWRLAFAVSPPRFQLNIWQCREFPALLRPELQGLGDVLRRIRSAAERIAPCVGVYQLAEYRPSKLDAVADEHIFRFVEQIRNNEAGEWIRGLRDAAGELAALVKLPTSADTTTDTGKKNRRLSKEARDLLRYHSSHRPHCQSDREVLSLYAQQSGKTFAAVEKMFHRARKQVD